MLSAVVVNYRNAGDTAGCVASLLAEETGLELVVVDNSADASETAALRALLPAGVKLHVNSTNLGFGAACNIGWRECSGNQILLINPDARVLPGALRKLQQALCDARDRGLRLAAVSPMQVWDESGRWMLPPAWLPTGIGLWALAQASRSKREASRLSLAYRRLAMPLWLAAAGLGSNTDVVQQRALSGGAIMIRRDAIESLGQLFDERFFMYYEDSDLCLRLRMLGWHLGMVPAAQVVHAWAHSSEKVHMMERSQGLYMAAHFEGRGQWAQRMQRSRQCAGLAQPLEEGLMETEPAWTVPEDARSLWLLEVSPSPLLIPAIGFIGQGPVATLPAHLRKRMGHGPVYGRIGSLLGTSKVSSGRAVGR